MFLPKLPIANSIDGLKEAMLSSSAVLTAPPGSGKTTIVPLELLNEPWLQQKKIIMLQPRRIAARTVCHRMAELLGEQPGDTVGYHIRHDRKVSKSTRIEVVTEGILTRRLQNDPELKGVGLIIFDEFHERSIHSDLGLALCIDLCQINEELKLLIMSATLDVENISQLLGDVPIIRGTGKLYEVNIEYHKDVEPRLLSTIVANSIKKIVANNKNDILVFLPGLADINKTKKVLEAIADFNEISIHPLYGQLNHKEQAKVLYPKERDKQRVILATDIAETSLTIEGVGSVIDSGWCKRPLFNPNNGLTSLTRMRISKSSATQRAGRAGRLGPGYCLRLYSQNTHHSFADYHIPEILRTDLSSLALELLMWGTQSPEELLWLNPPGQSSYKAAISLLQLLEAVDEEGKLTKIGRAVAGYPLSPRLGRLMLQAEELGQQETGAYICSLLSEGDIFDRKLNPSAEISLRLEQLKQGKPIGKISDHNGLWRPDLYLRVKRSAEQFLKKLRPKTSNKSELSAGSLLLLAYPDRIAQKIPGKPGSYKLATGRTVSLGLNDPLAHCKYLVVADTDGGQKAGTIFLAEPIDIETVYKEHPHLIEKTSEVYWCRQRNKIISNKRVHIGPITINETPLSNPSQELITNALKEGIQTIGLDSLLLSPKTKQLQARVGLLRKLQPDCNWPDLSIPTLEADLGWLEPYLSGIRNSVQLRELKFYDILFSHLNYSLQQQLRKYAPDHYEAPTGSKLPIRYTEEGPVLAIRIQELFGVSETPAICQGKLDITLHLLSPAHRPIQITSDLKGFWEGSYHEVKKDLKGRYPKHFWPDDPIKAEATKYTKNRKRTRT